MPDTPPKPSTTEEPTGKEPIQTDVPDELADEEDESEDDLDDEEE